MNFNRHSDLEGQHAFLSASKYHWINYDGSKLEQSYMKHQAAQRGTVIHSFAQQCILLGQKLPKSSLTLNSYVNDAIGFRMKPEQLLFYSYNSFGTADAISFRGNVLRIHDLKTGVSPVSMVQLEIYTALFCLEYEHNPKEIDVELRMYQSNQIIVHVPNPTDILKIMKKIIDFDQRIENLKNSLED
jgi:hypothetical protein